MNRPASLASVSGAKPVQPEMPIATLVSCAVADAANIAAANATIRVVNILFMPSPASWVDFRFSVPHAGVHNTGKPERVRSTRDSAPSVTSFVARSMSGAR